MEKKIILEGFTLNEFLGEVTESVRKALNPTIEQEVSRNKAAQQLGLDARTLKRAMDLCGVSILTPKSIELIRESYKKNKRR
jgi:hypothetical protein